jgi:hypothetical protein
MINWHQGSDQSLLKFQMAYIESDTQRTPQIVTLLLLIRACPVGLMNGNIRKAYFEVLPCLRNKRNVRIYPGIRLHRGSTTTVL